MICLLCRKDTKGRRHWCRECEDQIPAAIEWWKASNKRWEEEKKKLPIWEIDYGDNEVTP